MRFEPGERLVESDQILGRSLGGELPHVEWNSLKVSAATDLLFAPGAFDEDPTHRLGGRGEKMTAAVPVLGLVNIDKA